MLIVSIRPSVSIRRIDANASADFAPNRKAFSAHGGEVTSPIVQNVGEHGIGWTHIHRTCGGVPVSEQQRYSPMMSMVTTSQVHPKKHCVR